MKNILLSEKWNIYGTQLNFITDCPEVFRLTKSFLSYFPKRNGELKSVFQFSFKEVSREEYKSNINLRKNNWKKTNDALSILNNGDLLYLDFRSEAFAAIDKKNRSAEGLIISSSEKLNMNYESVFMTALLEMLRLEGFLAIHAAALSFNGNGVIFHGASGSGKTTLSIKFLQEGFKLLGDDRVLLRKISGKMEMFAFVEPLRVLPKTFNFFPGLDELNVEPAQRAKYKIPVEKIILNSIQKKCLPKVIIFPVVKFNKTFVRKISPQESLKRFLLSDLTKWDSSLAKESFEILTSLTENIPSYEIYTKNRLDSLVKFVKEFLET